MSALVVTIARFGLLILLWLFVIFALATVRNDVYGGSLPARKRANSRAQRQISHSNTAAQPGSSAQLSPQTLAAPSLYVLQGALAGTTIRISNSPIIVGRSPDSALVLDDGYASARHARFYLQDGKVILEDLSSTNGTWVNDQQVHGAITLPPGVRVTIGKTIMEVR
ncbi:FHA domain-containing protein FhaB/FipA [Arcanobacterium hippocoleae]|uniref:PSer/pThr/pTyr-binding forkhead associated (FHA) protein n=1 Tax=Arcanobacterium hippocoleae TaxID=149017 RepID=A0ABU1T3X6_9ACTO|nr:FHA domain-containing protein [Arcanobacterium hippocoleae]MDR6939540.1 pSer/pThr/pTyr-binding forkhead associated (FHA) protein [Arcanobacterium hippocoleae]